MTGLKRNPKTLIGLITLALICGALVACGSVSRLDPCDNSSLRLLEHEPASFCARYIDDKGFPIQAATIQCDIVDGDPNGANLEKFAQVTDASGEARFNLTTEFSTAFNIRCTVNDSGDSLKIPVTISRSNGATLEVRVTPAASAAVTNAEIILVEDFSCIGFDAYVPPAATSNAACSINGQRCIQDVSVAATGTNVTFSGLEPGRSYSVVSIGRLGQQIMAQGCTDGIFVTEIEVDQARAVTTTVNMFDVLTELSDNEIVVTTEFDRSLGLEGVAGLLQSLSDSEYDPADEIIRRAVAYTDGGILTSIIAAFRTKIAQYATPEDPEIRSAERSKLLNVSLALKRMGDSRTSKIRLTTAIEMDDESNGQAQLLATHRLKFLDITSQGANERFDLGTDGDVFVFSGFSNPLREAQTTVTVKDAGRITFDRHTLAVPIANAVMRRELLKQFGSDDLTNILVSMVDCSRVADAAQRVFEESGSKSSCKGGIWDADCWLEVGEDVLIRTTMFSICQNVVTDLITQINDQVRHDIQQSQLSDLIDFEGSADVTLRPDGRTIETATGQWIGVGGFQARRF